MTDWKQTLRLWGLSLIYWRAILFARPRVVRVTDDECEVRIPLNWRTRNHVKSMYIGVLAAGVDLAAGLMSMRTIEKSGRKVVPIFKDIHCDFHKLAKADVHFTCKEGQEIRQQVEETIKTGERINRTVTVIATTPSVTGDEPIATCTITLSVREKR